MTRNQKIALGCGGAGCLGLIIIAVASVIAYTFYYQSRSTYPDRNYNINTNTNRAESPDSSPSDDTVSSTDETEPSEDTSSSSMSDDDKHKLFQAAAMTGDSDLNRRVWRKLGFLNDNGTMRGEYEQFVRAHVGWTMRNVEFIQSIGPEQARAYVNEHIND